MFIKAVKGIDNYLAEYIGMRGIICIGVAVFVLGLIFTSPSQHQVDMDDHGIITEYKLSQKEKLIFKKETEKVSWCKHDKECRVLAEAIVYEVRSDSELGKVSVAHVILNRVNDPRRWGDTIKEVVYQPFQFSYTGKKQKNIPSQKDWKDGYLVAYEVLHGLVGSPVKEATHYHTKAVSPKWANSYEIVAVVDSHIFYR